MYNTKSILKKALKIIPSFLVGVLVFLLPWHALFDTFLK